MIDNVQYYIQYETLDYDYKPYVKESFQRTFWLS